MFARKFRLPPTIKLTNSLFLNSQSFTLKYGENKLPTNRYGFIVSKQIDKRATVRNRIKRQFRVCIEKIHKRMSTGYDMLFVLKKSALDKNLDQLCEEISTAFLNKQLLG